MPMPYDNLCKMLSEKYPDCFASWVLGEPQHSVVLRQVEVDRLRLTQGRGEAGSSQASSLGICVFSTML